MILSSLLFLASLFYTVMFALLYIAKNMEQAPGWLANLSNKINDNIDALTLTAFYYGLAAVALALLVALTTTPPAGYAIAMRYIGIGYTLRFVLVPFFVFVGTGLLISVLALPHVLDKVIERHQGLLGEKWTEKLRGLSASVEKHEKIAGYVSAFAAVLLICIT
ncbi:MAG: hypothetical protein OXT65_01840 [Alphaproteobacteria bacterium]|nr:hypothetical protein [Alphaproteobacteria bacterium]